MATQQAAPQPSTNHDTKQKKKPDGPPDETFWIRYSPHHEFPISTLASVMLHLLLGVAVLILFAVVILPSDSKPPVRIDVVQAGGGGGNPEGVGNGPGNGVLPKDRTEEATKNNVQTDTPPLAKNDDVPLPTPKMNQPQINLRDARFVPTDSGDMVARIQALRKQIEETKVGPVAGAGKGGPGKGGGKGRGEGTGTGDDKGPGSKLTPIERRLLRRVIKYDVGDGNVYRRELAGLGIILATPETRRDGTRVYKFYRDLNHVPPKSTIEDPGSIRRTFWEDTNPDTVRLLARALHIRPVPSEFIAFLPPDLEEEMLKKELAYKHVANEQQIKKTVFEVVPTRNGYDVIVQSQELYDN